MILSRRVSVGGVQLDSLDSRILILKVDDPVPDESRNAANLYAGDGIGSRITSRHIASKKFSVTFSLKINKRDYSARSKLIEKINKWAQAGGTLTSSTRPGRKMTVVCTGKAAVGDPREWTKEYTISFEANEKPYWENTETNSASRSTIANATLNLEASGELDTLLNATIQNASGASISQVKLTKGNYKIQLNDLGFAGGETLVIDHSSDNILRIRIRNTGGSYRSVMSKRTEDSTDEILLSPGNNAVAFSASRACNVTLSCVGRFS